VFFAQRRAGDGPDVARVVFDTIERPDLIDEPEGVREGIPDRGIEPSPYVRGIRSTG
jgi:hypothetical protein